MRVLNLKNPPGLLLVLLIIVFTSTAETQVFTPGGRFATAGSTSSVVTGDFDGDTDIDIAITQRYEDTIYIHLNDGSGVFAEVRKFRATRYGGLGAADVNNDSYCDLVTYDGGSFDYEEWGTTVYLNNGDVTFTRLCQDTIGSPDFALADFNGDNFTDIAVFNDDYYVPENRSIWIYSGLGDGNFAAPIILEPSATGGPKAGDVNDDGVVDLLFSIDYYPYCRLNNGDGTFADPISIHEGTNLGDLIEMNGDRYPDLFYAQTYGCVPRPAFRIGNGDGTFGPHQVAWTTAGLLSGINLAVADFNYDGHVDIALTAPENNFVDVGLNDGRMDFERFHDETIPLPTAGPMVTADFDGDGDYDLAVIEKSGRENDTLAIAFSTGAQHERTIIVPDDHLTVQDAVDYAWNLDTIFVCPGIYRECIDFDGKNIVFMSSECSDRRTIPTSAAEWYRQAAVTVLDGGDTCRVLTFDDFEDDRSVVSGFTIQNGNGAGLGGGVYCYDTAAPTITYNIIRDNYASSYGGAIATTGGPATIDHNLIYNNSSGFRGGALFIYGFAGVTNNTVYGNTTEDGCGGLYLNWGTPTICNNIFWNNSSTSNDQEVGPVTATTLHVRYSVVQGGFAGEGNLDTDPMFVDPGNGDFTLMKESPCINAGDPNSPLDPDGSIADIGAFYYPNPVGVDEGSDEIELPRSFALSQNYPNPFNPFTTIEYSLPERSHVKIDVFNILGQKVRSLVDSEKSAGFYKITWDGTTTAGMPAASGIYLYRFQTGDYVETKMMLLLK